MATTVDDLRILASIKLYLNSEFYAKHPSFAKVMNIHSGVFHNVDTLLALSISHCALASSKMFKYKIMFNQLIKPREFPSFDSETIHLLFCNNRIVPPTPFRHNHYMSLIFCSEKNKVNKKRKLITS